MSENIEHVLESMGLYTVSKLDEILNDGNLFVDSNYGSGNEFAVYPITDKAYLAHDLLSLYGTHWRYIVDISDLKVHYSDGDSAIILDNIHNGKKDVINARYAFTRKYLDKKKSLWLFKKDDSNADLYDTLLLICNNDTIIYETQKRNAKLTKKI